MIRARNATRSLAALVLGAAAFAQETPDAPQRSVEERLDALEKKTGGDTTGSKLATAFEGWPA